MMPIVPIAMALAQFAPTLMRFFGAGEPSVAVAEKVVGMAQQVTGAATPEEALERIKQDAAAQAAFQMRALELDAELEKAYLADRANARSRDVEIIKSGRSNTRADVLAYTAIALLGLTICLVFFKDLPQASRELLFTLIGALIMIVKDVYGFEFGTSKDSQRNAQVVADIAKAE